MCTVVCNQDWEYDRSKLIYLREIGEGQFGKVVLMKAKVQYIPSFRENYFLVYFQTGYSRV